MRPEKLAMMANQIATFFDTQGSGAPEAIADHLRKFWAPAMRHELVTLASRNGQGLKPSVVAAVQLLEAGA